MNQKGKLYICGTPIGNLDDITFRAVKTLKNVDLIAAEDTRRTDKLLKHFKIDNRLTSYHEHNEREKSKRLVSTLNDGYDIALVSDAGMPGISDPGLILVEKAIENNIEIIPIPGPTALISALVVSGLPTDRFTFYGFVPRKGRDREEFIEQIVKSEETTIFYESPYRIKKIYKELQDTIPERYSALIREITKVHEEKVYGTIKEVYEKITDREIKGEIVVVVEGREKESPDKESWTDISILEHVRLFMDNGYTKKEAIKKVAELREIRKKKVYQEAIQINVNR
ncbi:MAG: 16S rRNA (cytidine(1402)-2'-O)-methyltransferase [Halanaerobiales bacterium]